MAVYPISCIKHGVEKDLLNVTEEEVSVFLQTFTYWLLAADQRYAGQKKSGFEKFTGSWEWFT